MYKISKTKSILFITIIALVSVATFYGVTFFDSSVQAATLFSDNFDDGNATGWSTNSGTWSVVMDGSYKYKQTSTAGVGFAYPTDSSYGNWDNYSVEATVKITAVDTGIAGRQASISARYLDNNNRYAFVLADGTNRLEIRKKISGTETTIASKAYTVDVGTTYTVKGVLNGSTLEMWVNGNQELTVTDASRTTGKIALNNYGLAAAYDNVAVNTLVSDTIVTIKNDGTQRTNVDPESGCMIKEGSTFWWFGRNPSDNHQIVAYTSTDLVDWTYQGVKLTLTEGSNACRPWVFKNTQYNNFVMIIGVPGMGVGRNTLQFWTSSTIGGTYSRVGYIAQPTGYNMGDISGFQDGTDAYAIFASDVTANNSTTTFAKLNAYYTGISTVVYQQNNISSWPDYAGREAYTIIKRGSYYHAFCSETRSWCPSQTFTKKATTMSGFPTTGGPTGDGWTILGGTETDFQSASPVPIIVSGNASNWSQCDIMLPIVGTSGTVYMFVGDRWPNYDAHGCYDGKPGKHVFMPLSWSGDTPSLVVTDSWTLNLTQGTYTNP